MFIVSYDAKRTERTLGVVADFCPLCRKIRAFQLIRVGSSNHFCYISFGPGTLIEHIIRCSECGQALSADPLRYASFQKLPSAELDGLTESTFPNLKAFHAERLLIESKIAQAPETLTPGERMEMLAEPFRLLNPLVEERYSRDTQFDGKSKAGCLGSLGIFAILLGIACILSGPMQGNIVLVAFGVFGVGTVYTLAQLAFGPGRYLRTKIARSIAQTLAPLKPTREEISACLAKCKAAGMKIGQKLKPEVLWAELEKQADFVPEERLVK